MLTWPASTRADKWRIPSARHSFNSVRICLDSVARSCALSGLGTWRRAAAKPNCSLSQSSRVQDISARLSGAGMYVFTQADIRNRFSQNSQIEPHAAVLDIFNIQGLPALPGDLISAVDLRQACETRLHIQFSFL